METGPLQPFYMPNIFGVMAEQRKEKSILMTNV